MSLADEIIEGESCELCLSPFRVGIGYPCVCDECWRSLTRKERRDGRYQRYPEELEEEEET